ncbi:MAG TPA: hypothetical protein VGL19_11450 [Polyangiaceae bacterium]|jgi:DNA-directed RNA polymerase subunit M/transcription elongation factor TFIIS
MPSPVYEMLWDCRFCGQKKLLGLTHRHCPNCGAEQDASARYFPPDDERIAVQDHQYVGADIVCHYCAAASSRAAHNCGNCGAPLAEGQGVQTRADPGLAAGAPRTPSMPPKRFGVGLLVALVLGVLCLCGVLSSLLFWKKAAAFSVVRDEWSRSVVVETLGPVNDSAWCDQLPSGASNLRRHREQRSTKQVPNGEDCKAHKVDNGDGTFHEKQECTPKYKDEPVLDDKCDFRVDRWHIARTAKAQGADASNVRWPDAQLIRPGTCLGCEREGTRSETYTVVFQDAKAGSFRCDFAQQKWATFVVGSKWNGAIRRLVGTLDCDSLARP